MPKSSKSRIEAKIAIYTITSAWIYDIANGEMGADEMREKYDFESDDIQNEVTALCKKLDKEVSKLQDKLDKMVNSQK